jgi:hypothetical protein
MLVVMVGFASARPRTGMPTQPNSLVMRPVALHHSSPLDSIDDIE